LLSSELAAVLEAAEASSWHRVHLRSKGIRPAIATVLFFVLKVGVRFSERFGS
jgi:hypothetical protein